MSTVLRGWARARQSAEVEGLAEMREGVASHVATGARLLMPYWHFLLAEAHARTGAYDQARVELAEAKQAVEATGERYWEAEIDRLSGQLEAESGSLQAAEASYRRALQVARHQAARSLELRAAVGLARLWQRDGRLADARELLLGVYGWFTEGFETPDLRQARALLTELGVPAAQLHDAILLGGGG
jgi:predicted ATPase